MRSRNRRGHAMTGYTVGMSRGLGIRACVAILTIAGAARAQEASEPLAVAYEAPDGLPEVGGVLPRDLRADDEGPRRAAERARARDARRRDQERRAVRRAALDRGRECVEHGALRLRQDVWRGRLCAGAHRSARGGSARLHRADRGSAGRDRAGGHGYGCGCGGCARAGGVAAWCATASSDAPRPPEKPAEASPPPPPSPSPSDTAPPRARRAAEAESLSVAAPARTHRGRCAGGGGVRRRRRPERTALRRLLDRSAQRPLRAGDPGCGGTEPRRRSRRRDRGSDPAMDDRGSQRVSHPRRFGASARASPVCRRVVRRPRCVGYGIAGSVSRSRPWATLSALGRLVWEPLAFLDVELEAGVIAPLYRESFVFTPSVAVYEAPPVAFLSRAGLGLRFP